MDFLQEFSGSILHAERSMNYELIFWILMGINLLCVAAAKTLNQGYIAVLFNTAVINRSLLQKTQEELKLGSASSILLTLPYFINVAILLAYIDMQRYGLLALLILAILIGASIIKWLFMWGLIFVSQNRSGIAEHGMNHLIYYQVAGLILTPILLISHFLPAEIYQYIVLGSLIFAGLILLIREFQSVARAFKARISPFYIILYLCTLELMPLVLIIYAFVTNYSGLN